jgi:hypothetical protein
MPWTEHKTQSTVYPKLIPEIASPVTVILIAGICHTHYLCCRLSKRGIITSWREAVITTHLRLWQDSYVQSIHTTGLLPSIGVPLANLSLLGILCPIFINVFTHDGRATVTARQKLLHALPHQTQIRLKWAVWTACSQQIFPISSNKSRE